jgi:S-(hydroxymethyl)glutathione dehydrogenase / alcohol dehydrogenase
MVLATAAVCREFGKALTIEQIDVSEPGPDDVLVDIKACAVCHSDITLAEGGWGGVVPAVYGHEASGVVRAVGARVGAFVPGDRVAVHLIRSCGTCRSCERGKVVNCSAAFAADEAAVLHDANGDPLVRGLRTGAFSTTAVVDQSQVAHIGDGIAFETAALLSCGVITGFGAVTNTAQVEAGSYVVVIGCGGVGLNSIQGAVASGARRTIAVDLLDSKLADARVFGATDVVRADAADAADQIKTLTSGYGADYVFVTVGVTAAVTQALSFVGGGGAVVIVGLPPIDQSAPLNAMKLGSSNQRVLGSKMGGTRPRADIPALVDMYHHGRLKLDELITATYTLDQINEAIGSVNRGEARRNVIVFD